MKVIYVLIMYTYTLDLIWSLGLNCCCALLSKCNSNEGDSRRKHERHWDSVPRSAISGALVLYTNKWTIYQFSCRMATSSFAYFFIIFAMNYRGDLLYIVRLKNVSFVPLPYVCSTLVHSIWVSLSIIILHIYIVNIILMLWWYFTTRTFVVCFVH